MSSNQGNVLGIEVNSAANENNNDNKGKNIKRYIRSWYNEILNQ